MKTFRFAIRFVLAALLACACPFVASAQIPSGYVQTTATVSPLAGASYGAAWTNLSTSPQLALLGCVSTFQQTVNGNFDAYGKFSVLLADTAQICPAPSTWTFSITPSCPPGVPAASFTLQVPVTGGGGTEDISSQITAVLPATLCNGGSGGATWNSITGGQQTGSGASQLNTLPGKLALGKTVLLGDGTIQANLRAFGATASQQTASCTANGTATLTGCSIADFKVGDYVTVPASGWTPSISTPSGLTAVCGSNGSDSCTGGVVYGYKIAAIQGSPNGGITPVSSAVTVTQAAQTMRAKSGGSDVYTTVSWSAVTGANLYAIYRSVNSGPYSFYTLWNVAQGTTMTDWGHWQQRRFTCTDIGVPCTAPSSATPPDVYAQITGINGSSIALSPYANQPLYAQPPTGESAAYASAPSISGSVTVMHDDTPAMILAYQYLLSLGSTGSTALYIPGGTYNLHNATPYTQSATGTYGQAFSIIGLQNFTLYGDGDATLLSQSGDRTDIGTFINSVCGYSNSCQGSYFHGFSNNSAPVYTLVDPVNVGSSAATMATPAQASNFSSASPTNPVWVSIFNLVPSYGANYPADMWGETNAVIGANSTTGILNFLYPTDKMYSNSLTPPYNTGANGPPSISPIIGGITARNITLRDFSYYGPNQFTDTNTIVGFAERNITATVTNTDDAGMMNVRTVGPSFNVTEDSNDMFPAQLFAVAAAGSGNYKVFSNQDTALGMNTGSQMAGEGSADIEWANNSVKVDGSWDGAGPENLVGNGGYSNNFSFTGNTIQFQNTNFGGVFNFDATASGTMSNNIINIDTLGPTGSVQTYFLSPLSGFSSYLSINNNKYIVGTIDVAGGPQQLGSDSTIQPQSSAAVGNVAGGVTLYPYYGSADIVAMTMTGNVTSVNLGSNRIPGLNFILAFTQAASGGPYTLPSDCTDSKWATGAGIDCPNGPPIVNPAASSVTYLHFLDDGTAVHYLGSNYDSGSGTFFALSGDAISTSTGGATTVVGLDGVPFCSGYSPTSGQIPTYTTGGSPNPCYDATTVSGAGTVTSFSAGNLSPLFTTSVATATTTPALTFTISNVAANAFLAGPTSGSAASPTYRTIVNADIPTTLTGITIDGVTPTTMGYVDPTSSIQTQLNGKQASLSLVAGTYTNTDLCTYASSGTLLNCNTATSTFQPAGTYVTPTTLNNDTLPASVTNLAASGTVTFPGIEGAGTYCLQISSAGALSNTGSACGSGGGGDTITSPSSTLVVGGSSSNTTLDLAGSAGEIMAGATPALTYTPTLGKSGTAGTLALFPASGNFTTTLASAATASNTVDFFATVPTNLDLFYCAVSSTTCTLTDAGYAYNSIPNADLAHSAITIAGTSVSLGGSTSSLPSPGAIGGTTPAAITGTTITANTSLTINGGTAQTGTQGTDTKLLTAGTISGTGASLCTDANGGATTSGCSSGSSGLSGMTAGQVPIAATASTVTSSEPLAGSGAGIVTGPTSSTNGDAVIYTGTSGQTADAGFAPAPALGNVTDETTSWSLVANNIYRFTGTGASNATTPATVGATGVINFVNAGTANVTVVTGTPTLVCIPASCVVQQGASAFINTDGTDQYAIISNANGSAFGTAANSTAGTSGSDVLQLSSGLVPAASFPAETQDVTNSAGSLTMTVKGLNTVPFCTGFAPTNGQLIQYTTAGSPNPCYTSATAGLGGDTISSPNSTLVVGGTTVATTLDLAGSAGEIMAGATPALTYTPTLGKSGTAGTLAFFPASGNFTTTLGTAATANNTFLLPAAAPTNLHCFYAAVSGTTTTLTDCGYAYNSIPNGDLANSSVTFNGVAVSLGSTGNINTSTSGDLLYSGGSGAALNGTGDFTFATHTLSGGASAIFDMSAATTANAFKVPAQAGLTSGADGVIAYDTTGKLTHIRTNGADSSVIAETSTSTTTTQVLHATAVAGVGAFGAIAAGDLPAANRITPCGVGIWGGGTAIASGTYHVNARCLNVYGVTYTITGVTCQADNSGSSTANVADSGSNALLTGAITMGTANTFVSGTQSATTTIASNVWTNWTFVADGTSTSIQCVMTTTR